jgi:hypothetical protein
MQELFPTPLPNRPNRSQIQGHCSVSLLKTDKGSLTELKNKLVEIALYHPKIGVGNVIVPATFVALQKELESQKRAGVSYLT